jgi:acetyl/propionyl-CoA carboxylase alpha subunit
VTERVTGVDLVEEMIRVAGGHQPLGLFHQLTERRRSTAKHSASPRLVRTAAVHRRRDGIRA